MITLRTHENLMIAEFTDNMEKSILNQIATQSIPNIPRKAKKPNKVAYEITSGVVSEMNGMKLFLWEGYYLIYEK